MRNKFFSACLVASSALLATTAVNAEGTNIQRGAYLGGQAAYNWFDHKGDSSRTFNEKHNESFGGQIGFRFAPHFSIEASYTEGKANPKYDDGDKILHQTILGSARFHFNNRGVLGFEPYLGIAAGNFWEKPKGESRHKVPVVAPELGVQRRFLNRVLLDVGARAPYDTDHDRWQGQAYAGLNFLFAVSDRHEVVEEEPEEYVEPEPQPEPEVVEREVDERGTAALFGFDEDSLSDDQLDDLRSAAEFLDQNPKTNVTLEGHTDNIGDEEYNQKLSERRADTAKQFLLDESISEGRIETIGKGFHEPIADNDTDEGRQRNRRVDAIFSGVIEEIEEH